MEPEIGAFGNVTTTNVSTSGGHDETEETWESSALLLWVPHVSIGFVLVLLVLLSFVRFHSKNGHKYRKSTKGPRPAWQELGMHDFLWQIQQQNVSGDASSARPAFQARQLYQGCVWYHDVGSAAFLDSRPSTSSDFGPALSSDFGPTLTLLHSPISVHVMSDAGTTSPDSGTGSVFNSRPELSPNSSGSTSLPSQVPDVLPNLGSTSLTSQGRQVSPHSGPTPSSSPGSSSSPNPGPISSPNPGPASSPNPGPIPSPNSGPTSVFEMATPIRTEDTVPATISCGNCDKTEVTTFASGDLHAPRPSFIWTLGTDRVRDSSTGSGGQASPGAKAKGVWNAERNRARSEVVLRSNGPLRAITTVALSNSDAEDKERLLNKSPL